MTPRSARTAGTSCLTWPIASRSIAEPGSARSVVKPCAEIASTPSGPSSSGSTNDAAE